MIETSVRVKLEILYCETKGDKKTEDTIKLNLLVRNTNHILPFLHFLLLLHSRLSIKV